MIHLRPFRAWRPTAYTAHLVGSRSYVQYSHAELESKLAGNPYTFLQVVHADHDTPGLTRGEHYDRVRAKFDEFVGEGIFVRERIPALYLYEQSCGAFTSRGVIGTVDVDDYFAGRVKRHEQTLATREELFTDYLGHTRINAEPVLLGIPDDEALEAGLDRLCQGPTLYDFATTDRVRHRFWRVDAPADVQWMQAHFGKIPEAYIADGHHRCASSALLARQASAPAGSPKAGFLAFLVPERQLHIYNYDRLVQGLNGQTAAEFLDALRQVGPVTPLADGTGQPEPGHVSIYLEGSWHDLRLPESKTQGPLEQLDAEKLNKHVLGPLLGIHDLRTDPRIRFVPGTMPARVLQQKVDGGKGDVAFHLRAITFGDLRAVADINACMPPKTTWIEPKLRSGLTIYSLEDQ